MTGENSCHVIVWEFRIRPEKEKEFVEKYGPDGMWARFFQGSRGYIRTELVRDVTDTLRFLTLDYWRSHEDFESFRKEHQQAYEKFSGLIASEGWIEREVLLGSFYKDESDFDEGTGLVPTTS